MNYGKKKKNLDRSLTSGELAESKLFSKVDLQLLKTYLATSNFIWARQIYIAMSDIILPHHIIIDDVARDRICDYHIVTSHFTLQMSHFIHLPQIIGNINPQFNPTITMLVLW